MAEAKEFVEPELVKHEETLADLTAGNNTGYNNHLPADGTFE